MATTEPKVLNPVQFFDQNHPGFMQPVVSKSKPEEHCKNSVTGWHSYIGTPPADGDRPCVFCGQPEPKKDPVPEFGRPLPVPAPDAEPIPTPPPRAPGLIGPKGDLASSAS